MLKKVFSYNGPLHTKADGVSFGLYSADEIKKLSVVKVITPLSFGHLGQPLPGGLYDPAMGPYSQGTMCGTCQQTMMYCPGHFGHIELPLPVLNPLINKTLINILRMSCLNCHRSVIPVPIKELSMAQLKLLEHGCIEEAQNAEFLLSKFLNADDNTDVTKTTSGSKKGRAGKFFKNIDTAQSEFDTYVENVLKSDDVKRVLKHSSKNVEALRHLVMKRVYSYSKMGQKCLNCGFICKKLVLYEGKVMYSYLEKRMSRAEAEGRGGDKMVRRYLTPAEAKNHLREIWKVEHRLLQRLFPVLNTSKEDYPSDMLFIDVILVPPSKNRPAQMVNGMNVEHPQNIAFRNVVTSCVFLLYAISAVKNGQSSLSAEAIKALNQVDGKTLKEKMETIWNDLQADVDHVMDRDKSRKSAAAASQMLGLKQIIEKKEGLFRMNMMGKRVNYAARTVITPDPNIHIEEIGIPDVFAKVLTFPEVVTPFNIMHLRKLVTNGPDIHPGAVAVEGDDGRVTRLDPNDLTKRMGIANRLFASDKAFGSIGKDGVKTVYRHLKNGDLLCLNRQPSLHRPSIMAHRARVLRGEKVFRLHYANCKHYNADFDGDEMNAHFAQSYLAKSEAAHLVNVCSHYLVPKDGTPLGGLIQDHVVAGVKMTVRGRFFSKRDYQELVYFALSGYSRKIETEPPTILKPVQLWSGKQVISTVIKNLVPVGRVPLTLVSSSKIKADEWRQCEARNWKTGGPIKGDELSDSVFIVRDGLLLCGVLDKMHLGSTPYGLCHAFHELYGSKAVGAIISAFSRLMTNFLQWEGFTLGLKDVLVTRHADKLRREYMREAKSIGPNAAATGVGLPELSDLDLITEKLEEAHRSSNVKDRAVIDLAYKRALDQYTNKINKCILPHGLLSIFPHNNLQLLVQSGAKGSTVNTMQMSCLLGQIELEGKRPPLTVSGKSLPCFKAYDPSPRAGGYIAGRFLTGIRPQEFFFHCMAGREGLIDTAVKTSRSGYLQRCLVKLLEGLVTHYDGTVRDSDGSVIQFLYGEDGLDVCKSQFLKSKHFKFLEANSERVLDEELMAQIRELGNSKQIRKEKNKLNKWIKLHADTKIKPRLGSLLEFYKNADLDSYNASDTIIEGTGRSVHNMAVINDYLQYKNDYIKKYSEQVKRCPDPLVSYLRPECNFSVVSESLENMLDKHFDQSKHTKKEFREVIYYKAMQALSVPGDAVGVLAAQSIGEPSTQMTLNTFHFAGRGEMNVTLGIPRLREILMVASAKIKTPSMDIPFREKVSEEKAERIRLILTRVTLAQVLQYVDITETVDKDSLTRAYQLTFTFLPHSKYSSQFCVTPKKVLAHFEKTFLRSRLLPAIRSETRMKGGSKIDASSKKGGGFGGQQGDMDNADAVEPQVDLYSDAQKKGTGDDHESSDEEPEPEDADATQAIRRARHTEAEYDEPEDEEKLEEEKPEEEGEEYVEGDENAEEGGEIGEGAPRENPNTEYENEKSFKKRNTKKGVSMYEHNNRASTVMEMDSLIVNYDFDMKAEEWCKLTVEIPLNMAKVNMGSIVREAAEKSVIHQVANISRAFLVRVEDRLCLKTEGINILAMAAYRDFLDLNRLYCNNIHTMAESYGIEAASRVIVKEMTDVFKAYGITIDPRHLTLIADYMTFTGTYRPFNRIGIESSSSPLQQMSFETVVSFLREAALTGKSDSLQTPSAQLILGRATRVGTGLFDLCAKI